MMMMILSYPILSYPGKDINNVELNHHHHHRRWLIIIITIMNEWQFFLFYFLFFPYIFRVLTLQGRHKDGQHHRRRSRRRQLFGDWPRVVQPAHQRIGWDPHQIRRRWQRQSKVSSATPSFYLFSHSFSFIHLFVSKRIHDAFAHVQLSDIRVIATLGVGGFGRVELVQITNDTSRSYGLKQMKKSQVNNWIFPFSMYNSFTIFDLLFQLPSVVEFIDIL